MALRTSHTLTQFRSTALSAYIPRREVSHPLGRGVGRSREHLSAWITSSMSSVYNAVSNVSMSNDAPPRVLSIQSHVVHGYVGNKCSVFVLQQLGVDVDPINTVQFSNHTGYPKFTGRRMQNEEFEELVSGLRENGLLNYSHILTGYIGSPGVLHSIAQIVSEQRKEKTGITFFCDPVMGDNGALYVSPELVSVYKTNIVTLADVLTPNQTELELLTDMVVKNEEDVIKACADLHALGPHTVVVTSTNFGDNSVITVVASTVKAQAAGHASKMKFTLKKLPGYYSGTGDVFASLLLFRLHENPDQIDIAIQKTLGSLTALLEMTHEKQSASSIEGVDAQSFNRRELCLIQGSKCLANPPDHCRPIPLD